ncbi:response regulator [Paenibacillaceae bacterium]|nr:response regulator [Paenibacillaceae bacterium]
MNSIMLVDDERLELEMMHLYIDWRAMGIEVITTARNGREAFEKYKAYQPDIVLTDVKMPIMDGLQLAKQIKEHDERTKVVFLSGHDEFDYIKAALNIEAAGYLLKPLDRKELADTMEKVKAKCRRDEEIQLSRSVWAAKSFASLLAEGTEQEETSRTFASLLKWDTALGAGLHIGIVSVDNPQTRSAGLEPLSIALHHYLASSLTKGLVIDTKLGEYMILRYGESLQHEDLDQWWHDLLAFIRAHCSFTATIGHDSGIGQLEQLQHCYCRAKQAVDFKFYAGGNRVIAYLKLPHITQHAAAAQEAGSVTMPDIGKPLLRAVRELNAAKAVDLIAAYYAAATAARPTKDAVYRSAIHLLNTLFEDHPRMEEQLKHQGSLASDWPAHLYSLDSIAAIQDSLVPIVHAAIAYFASRQSDRNSAVISKALEFIGSRLHTAITVEDIAATVYLSPNYLRTVFKEATGMTILEYMTQKRMARATELLHDRSLKIHEIAARVGYDNTSYFCSIFQRHKGLTPSDYRKKSM